jgi:hypothetical protein
MFDPEVHLKRIMTVLSLLLHTSCATIVSGTHENIEVTSSPAGAEAALKCSDGTARHGLTPLTVSIPRKAGDCTVEVAHDGYATESVRMIANVNPVYWYNFVTTPLVPAGVIGLTGFLFSKPDAQSRIAGVACLLTVAAAWSIDHHTGADRAHSPAKVHVSLKPKG